MKVLKPIYVSAFAVATLVGCKSISNIPVPTGNNTAVNIPEKKAALTKEELNSWSHADLETDTIPGMSIQKAYDFLKGKKSKNVVVAVVDSGTDIFHEDLKDNIWVNPKEIAGNGKDDDKNGYIDDINGWNFLGTVTKENYEADRIYANPKITDEATYNEIKKERDAKKEKSIMMKTRFEQMLQGVSSAHEALSKHLNKENYTKEDVDAIKTDDNTLMQYVNVAQQMYSFGLTSLPEAITEIKKELTKATNLLNDKPITNYREALGDDENDMSITVYGDNKPEHKSDKESHGTHVSGIIGAIRNNGKGMDGVANNVSIMAVRTVPDGDEYDKDVALGIRYAVDNGAKVINTSFGKAYSPHKEWVWDAIKYAEKHDVLIVNAAGNDGKNIDVEKTFPNDSKDLLTEISDNFITIGAMSANYNENLPASFSNYGKKNVDVFAPGVKVYSTIPSNKYAHFSGTSMAAPSTAGVAALIRSYYPKLTASQVKHILMNSGTKIDLKVVKPGSYSAQTPKGELVPFSELSVSGRVVNAYNALRMADRMVNGK